MKKPLLDYSKLGRFELFQVLRRIGLMLFSLRDEYKILLTVKDIKKDSLLLKRLRLNIESLEKEIKYIESFLDSDDIKYFVHYF